MNIKAMQPTYRVQPLVRVEKARREKPKAQVIKQEIKREFADRETKVISILAAILLILCVASQIGHATGVIDGPMYLSDFVR